MNAGSLRFWIVAVIMLATALVLQAHSRSEFFPPRESLSSLPPQIDGWTGTDSVLDQDTLDILGPGEFLVRDYENASHPTLPTISLYIAYFPTQKTGDTIHSPNHCLPGAGWVPTSREVVQITRPDGSSFPANRYVVSKSGERPELVLYWFQAHGRAVASEYQAKYYLISVPCQSIRGFKRGKPGTGGVLVSGSRPRGGQRVLGQVLPGVRFGAYESQRRRAGSPHDPNA